jgi:predicted nucleic acid-binding protein
MKRLFLDTGFLIALEAADDQHHKVALGCWKKLGKSLPVLVITSYVFDEVVTFFNSRHRQAKAVEIGNILLGSPSVKMVHIDEALFHESWRYFLQRSDKTYSFTDCASFVVMKQLRIRTALTFDKHFAQAGFEQMPEPGSNVAD